jgi:hypothetical protein
MAICDQIVFNSELLINESHTNKYIFILDSIPTSYLLSKFTDEYLLNLQLQFGKNNIELEKIRQEVFVERNTDLKNFLLFVQNVDLPEMNVGYASMQTQMATVKHVMGKLEFGDLTMNVMNDEDWFVYRLMYFWLLAAHNPEEHMKFQEYEYYKRFYVNGTLLILNNHQEKVFEMEIKDLHPASIGQIQLKESEPDKIILPITWVHSGIVPSDRYVIKKV